MSSIPDILQVGSSLHQSPLPHARPSHGTIATFPEYKIAVLLLQNYESVVDPLCRVLHLPSVRSMLKSFYWQLNQARSPPPGEAALLLSLFALSAFFYQGSVGSQVPQGGEDSLQLSKAFATSALDVLDHSRRATSGTLEDVQAYILMMFVIFHFDGFSARGRLLLTTAISLARDLGLHRLDSEAGDLDGRTSSARVLIDREVKRRVFWFLASTDWYWCPDAVRQ